MALTDQEITTVARELAKRIYMQGVTADSNRTALKAAIQAIDQGMEATTNQIQTQYPATVLKVALRDHIKASAPNFTNQQAGVALALWALNEVGLI